MSFSSQENLTLELKIISAMDVSHDLKTKIELYAVVSITGDKNQRKQVSKTPIDFNGGSNPTWNHTVKFSVNEEAANKGQFTLKIKLFSHWLEEETDLYLGKVNVWVHELLAFSDFRPLINGDGDRFKLATYPVKNKEETNGTLSISYRFKPKEVADLNPPVSGFLTIQEDSRKRIEYDLPVYPFDRLKTTSTNPIAGIDATRREAYLSVDEFKEKFGMKKEAFYKLPKSAG